MHLVQDDPGLLADYEQYRARAYKAGHYTNEGDISVAVGQKKVFIFKFTNLITAASIVILLQGCSGYGGP